MRLRIVFMTLVATVSVIDTTHGQQKKSNAPTSNDHYVQHTFQAGDGTKIDYWLMSPAETEGGKKYPLVLALHGRGGNTTAATVLGSDSLRDKYPCFVMAPASTRAGTWAVPEGFGRLRGKPMLPAALEAMEKLIDAHPIDADRVYVTGQSMGGAGTFGALSLRPDLFAAAIPVCGGWSPQEAGKMKHIPIWVFHGDADKTVPVNRSRDMVKALKDAGGSPKYTEYPGVGHNSWTKTYADGETWQWLFGQQRSDAESPN